MVYLADYSIWRVLREKVYRSKIADVDELKARVWSMSERSLTTDQSIVDAAISRLAAFVHVRGAH